MRKDPLLIELLHKGTGCASNVSCLRLFGLLQFVWIMVGAKFIAASFGDCLRSQIIFSSPLENFRDPDSRSRVLARHRSVSQKLAAHAMRAHITA